jgi:hypothetical protein
MMIEVRCRPDYPKFVISRDRTGRGRRGPRVVPPPSIPDSEADLLPKRVFDRVFDLDPEPDPDRDPDAVPDAAVIVVVVVPVEANGH